MQISVQEKRPGQVQAVSIQSKFKQLGIQDVEFFYDETIVPHGMWAVCQVNRPSGIILDLRGDTGKVQPEIMWWCKTNDGHFRVPSEQDLHDIIVTVERSHKLWEKGGDWMADRLDEQDKARDEKHRQKLKDKVHKIAPAMKKAIRENNL